MLRQHSRPDVIQHMSIVPWSLGTRSSTEDTRLHQVFARPNDRFGSFSSILACPQHVGLGVNLGNADCPVLPIEGIGLDVIQTARDRTLRASDAEQRDRTMRSLSWGAHSRDPLASPGERCTASGTRENLLSTLSGDL